MDQSSMLRGLAGVLVAALTATVLWGCGPAGPQPSAQPDNEQAARPPAQPESAPAAESKPEPRDEPEPRHEPGPEGEPESEPTTGPELEPTTEREGPPDEEPFTLPEPLLEPEPSSELELPGEPGPSLPDEPGVELGPYPAVEPEPAAEPLTEPEPQPQPAWDLGPPLVDQPEKLTKLDPIKPIWLDKINKRVVMVGQVCQREVPLELFACLRDTKEHEAIVTVDIQAATAHAGLLALGAEPGNPVQFDPAYKPASGTEIEVTVIWNDKDGNRKTARAQDWILDIESKKAMAHPWVFAGSGFWVDEETGQRYYRAEGGDFICVSNFSSAMLDLPIESSQANSALLFRAYTERIPPLGTPVTLLLKPKLEKQKDKGDAEAASEDDAAGETSKPDAERPESQADEENEAKQEEDKSEAEGDEAATRPEEPSA